MTASRPSLERPRRDDPAGPHGTLAACGLAFIIRLAKSVIASRRHALQTTPGPPAPHQLAIGFVTNFLDTLGIGSFATTTAIFRLLGEPADELIPGTLIAGHALPVLAQALIFINVVSVDPAQLGLLIAASIAGGWLGAGVVSSLSRRAVQLGMGAALLTAAAFMVVGCPVCSQRGARPCDSNRQRSSSRW